VYRAYFYAFNGMEQDPELKGNGNSYTTEFRQYDPRLGRWLSIDPLASKEPGWSPYRAFFDNPIIYSDPNGLYETERRANREAKKAEKKGYNATVNKGVFDGKTSYTVYVEKTYVDGYGQEAVFSSTFRNGSITKERLGDETSCDVYDKDGQLIAIRSEYSVADRNHYKKEQAEQELKKRQLDQRTRNIDKIASNSMQFLSFIVGLGGGGSIFANGIKSYAAQSTLKGTVNAIHNYGSQTVANNGDVSKNDVAGTAIAFASGFLPDGGFTQNAVNVVAPAVADGLIDYKLDGSGLQTTFNGTKTIAVTANDIGWGVLSNTANNSFGKDPVQFQAIGQIPLTYSLQIGNTTTNNLIEKKK
jgi:RHS repeat-associated protein